MYSSSGGVRGIFTWPMCHHVSLFHSSEAALSYTTAQQYPNSESIPLDRLSLRGWVSEGNPKYVVTCHIDLNYSAKTLGITNSLFQAYPAKHMMPIHDYTLPFLGLLMLVVFLFSSLPFNLIVKSFKDHECLFSHFFAMPSSAFCYQPWYPPTPEPFLNYTPFFQEQHFLLLVPGARKAPGSTAPTKGPKPNNLFFCERR